MENIFDSVKNNGERFEAQAFTLIRGDDLNEEAKKWGEEDEAFGTVYDDKAVYFWTSDGIIEECETQEHLEEYL